MYASVILRPSIVNNAKFVAKGHPKEVLRKFLIMMLTLGLVKKEEVVRWIENAGSSGVS